MTAASRPRRCRSFRTRTAAARPRSPRAAGPALGAVTADVGVVERRVLPEMKASVPIDAGKVEGEILVPNAAVTGARCRSAQGRAGDRE